MRRRGVTLFGVLVATVVMTLAVIPLVGLLISQSRQTGMSRDRVTASALAHAVVERFRMESLGQLRTALESVEAGRAFIAADPVLTPPDAPVAWRAVLGRFQRSVVLVPISDRQGLLDAFVQWTEDGKLREVRVRLVVVDTRLKGGRP